MDKTDLLYEFLVDFFNSHGYAPTYQEMADGIGLASKAPIRPLLLKLRKKGLIKMERDSSKFALANYKLVPVNNDDAIIKGVVAFPNGEAEVEIEIVNKQIVFKIPKDLDISNWYHAVYIASDERR